MIASMKDERTRWRSAPTYPFNAQIISGSRKMENIRTGLAHLKSGIVAKHMNVHSGPQNERLRPPGENVFHQCSGCDVSNMLWLSSQLDLLPTHWSSSKSSLWFNESVRKQRQSRGATERGCRQLSRWEVKYLTRIGGIFKSKVKSNWWRLRLEGPKWKPTGVFPHPAERDCRLIKSQNRIILKFPKTRPFDSLWSFSEQHFIRADRPAWACWALIVDHPMQEFHPSGHISLLKSAPVLHHCCYLRHVLIQMHTDWMIKTSYGKSRVNDG